jgi:signal transduction histidine kinase/DNA-binding response OmpR family regulator/HAMP domain-containing protein
MRFSIAAKLGLSAAALVLVMTCLTGTLFYQFASQALTRQELAELSEDTGQHANTLGEQLDSMRRSAEFVAQQKFAQTALGPAPAADTDRDELAKLFTRVGQRPQYLSVSLLRAEDRTEVVRCERDAAGASEFQRVRQLDPQPRAWTGRLPELEAAQAAPPGVVVFSDCEFCGRGPVPQPGTDHLELRAVAPVRPAGKEATGLVVIRADLGYLVRDLNWPRLHLTVFLTDWKGRFLVHPDHERRLKDNFTVQDDPMLGPLEWLRSAPPEPKPGERFAVPESIDPAQRDRRKVALGDRSFWLLNSAPVEDPQLRQRLEQALPKFREDHKAVEVSRFDNPTEGLVVSRFDNTTPGLVLSSPDEAALARAAEDLSAQVAGSSLPASLTSGLSWGPRVHCTDCALTLEKLALPAGARTADGQPVWLGLAVGVSYQEIDAGVWRTFRLILLVILVLSLAAALLALAFSAYLTRPLNRLIAASDQVAKGQPFSLPRPKEKAPRDEIGRLVLTYHNMLEQLRQREHALKAAEAHTRTILDQAAEGVLTLDEHGTIESFNRAAEEIFEYRAPEVIGKNYRILVTGRSRDGEGLFGPSPGSSGSSFGGSSLSPEKFNGYTRVVTGRRKNGDQFPAEVSVREVPIGDRQVFVAIARDITERVRTQEQAERYTAELDRRVRERTAELTQAMHSLEQARDLALEAARAKDAFLANMSHELRTPLNAIIGYCEYLQEDPDNLDPEEALGDLKKIERAGKHLLTLINDILDLAKIEAGKMKLEPAEFDIPPLVRELEELIDPLVRARGNCLTVQAAADLGAMWADRHRVKQVILNLLSNANKFTDRGSILLTAQREPAAGGDRVVFRVADTGKGMSAEDVKKLFQPFFQADSSTTRKHEGTGLGLAISRRLCNMMGGDVEVQSRLGEGSTFIVRLPASGEPAGPGAAGPAPPAEARPADAAPPAENPAGPNTVVVIDDDPQVRELMERFLGKEGYAVCGAPTGEEGLRLVRRLRPRAVTLDVMMPGGLDGWGVLAALKSDPATAGIPVIMSTIVDDKSRGFALGATDYITKPIDWGRLSTVLHGLGASRSDPVLVIEDDPSSRELARRTLTRDGWEVLEADNGKTGLAQARKRRPAVILLDLMMPEMDGFQFLEEKRKDAALSEVPVIVVTAADLTEADRRRLNGSVRQIIQKNDQTAADLLAQVRDLMARAAAAPPAAPAGS